jgi:hypothetical protein
MKIKCDFITNSSSSSYIVYLPGPFQIKDILKQEELIDFENPEQIKDYNFRHILLKKKKDKEDNDLNLPSVFDDLQNILYELYNNKNIYAPYYEGEYNFYCCLFIAERLLSLGYGKFFDYGPDGSVIIDAFTDKDIEKMNSFYLNIPNNEGENNENQN